MNVKLRAAQRTEWARQEEMRRRRMILIWAGVAVIFVAMLGYLVYKQAQPPNRPGQDVTVQGRDHIAEGVPHDPYNSDPPTSGPHYAQPAQAGFYDDAPADEYLVHSMEHGYVIIWYNCAQYTAGTCDDLKAKVRDTLSRAGVSAISGTLKLIAVPRPSMPQVLALTAWGRIDKLTQYNASEIIDFIKAFRDTRAPEPGGA
ncbi:MAG: DUF3105 domain-containing protein [Anaerolineales bacterium]